MSQEQQDHDNSMNACTTDTTITTTSSPDTTCVWLTEQQQHNFQQHPQLHILEETIERMKVCHICAPPLHNHHSFQSRSLLVSFPQQLFRKCAICQTRGLTMWNNNHHNKDHKNSGMVQCTACGIMVHRSHIMSSSSCSTARSQQQLLVHPLLPPCSVNIVKLQEAKQLQLESHQQENDNAGPSPSSTIIRMQDNHTTTVDQTPTTKQLSSYCNILSRALQDNIMAHFQTATQTYEFVQKEEVNQNEHDVDHTNNTMDAAKDEPPHTATSTNWKTAILTGGCMIAAATAGMVVVVLSAAAATSATTTAAVLGSLLLEGGTTSTTTTAVIVVATAAGTVAGTVNNAAQRKQQQKQRIITMGEEGIAQKVLLVRPNIYTDPIWDNITQQAIDIFTQQTTINNNNPRYQREHDITQENSYEIPTNDKVTLLVFRIMNDKTSLPGFVYRFLLQTFHQRNNKPRETSTLQTTATTTATTSTCSSRARRDDVHAIIKHTTATLLNVKPSLGATATLTELTATAVERLVFSQQLYDLIMEEIQKETEETDRELLRKIDYFEKEEWVQDEQVLFAEEAIDALFSIPNGQSAAEKLGFCVLFLEKISDYFSNKNTIMCTTDSLLKMVCQHIVKAKMPRLNAEIAFLDEFARDEQLLRGREGYALVTLQASLHFLNTCEDIEKDIFMQDDDDEEEEKDVSSEWETAEQS